MIGQRVRVVDSKLSGYEIVLTGQPRDMPDSWDLSDYERLQREIASRGLRTKGIPAKLISFFRRYIDNKESSVGYLRRLSKNVSWSKLRPYQQQLLVSLVKMRRAMNLSEMGTGKTAVAIGFIEYWGVSDTLIVCPSSLTKNWKTEITKFSEMESHIVTTSKSSTRPGINIMSYNIARLLPPNREWKTIILDESHYIKSRNSKRSKHMLKLTRRASNVLLLSGTPLSKTQDLYMQLKALDYETFQFFSKKLGWGNRDRSEFYFGDRYCNPTVQYLRGGRRTYVFNGSARADEVHAIVRALSVRMVKQDVLTLPPKTRTAVSVYTMSEESSRDQLQTLQRIRDEEGVFAGKVEINNIVLEHSFIKLPHVERYLRRIWSGGVPEKTIVFAHHQVFVKMLVGVANALSIRYFVIDGSTKSGTRQALVDALNHSDEFQIGILSVTACGVGLNISGVHRVIFAELCWSDTMMVQAEDRCHRMGQQHPVDVVYLMVTNSMDDIIWRSVQRKQKTSSRAIDNIKRALVFDKCKKEP